MSTKAKGKKKVINEGPFRSLHSNQDEKSMGKSSHQASNKEQVKDSLNQVAQELQEVVQSILKESQVGAGIEEAYRASLTKPSGA